MSTARSVPLLPQGASCTGEEETLAACSGGGPGGATAEECALFLPATVSLICFSSMDIDTGEICACSMCIHTGGYSRRW